MHPLLTPFLILRNALDYPLRQLIRWRRGGLAPVNEPKDGLYAHLPPLERAGAEAEAARLRQAYPIEALYSASRADHYRENLYYLALLERALQAAGARLPTELHAADIGPSSWFYVQALYALLQARPNPGEPGPASRQVSLAGYESDPYRLYADFHSRMDHALMHLRGLPETVQYVPQPFQRQPASLDLALLLFPFVFLEDHLRWGLPVHRFAPLFLLVDAWESLRPGGWLVIVNQGEAEHHAQRAMLAEAAIRPAASLRFESPLYRYDLPRYILAARRG